MQTVLVYRIVAEVALRTRQTVPVSVVVLIVLVQEIPAILAVHQVAHLRGE